MAVLQQTFSQILGRQFSTNDMRVLYSNLDSFRDGADDQLVREHPAHTACLCGCALTRLWLVQVLA